MAEQDDQKDVTKEPEAPASEGAGAAEGDGAADQEKDAGAE